MLEDSYFNFKGDDSKESWEKLIKERISEYNANENEFDAVEPILLCYLSLKNLKNQPISELIGAIAVIADQNKLDLVLTKSGIYSTKYAFDKVKTILENSIRFN